MGNKIKNSFLAGLAITIPIALTVYVLQFIFKIAITLGGEVSDPLTQLVDVTFPGFDLLSSIIGLMIEVTFFRNRGKSVKVQFQLQVVEEHSPTLYLFTQHLGDLKISPLMSLDEWVKKGEDFESEDFKDL